MRKKNNLILLVGLFAFIMVVGGVSYGYFVYNKEVATVDLNSGEISIDYSSNNSNLTLSNVIGMSDELGQISTNYLDFAVTGKADIEPILYELEIVSSNSDLNDYIRVYLTDTNDNPILSPFGYNELYDAMKNDGKTIYQNLVEGNVDGSTKITTENFRLRVWLDESYSNTAIQNFTISTYMYAKNVNINDLRQITFNMQDGRNNGPVKYVTLGEDYGSLPTPIRDGYVFLGWNGKNLFPDFMVKKSFDYNTGALKNANTCAITDFIPVDFATNSAYVFSLSSNYKTMFAAYNENFEYIGRIGGAQRTSYTLTASTSSSTNATGVGGVVSYVRVMAYEIDNGTIEEVNNFEYRLEVGNTISNEYEPYYVTSSVKLTERNNDYVLNAIWQENS